MAFDRNREGGLPAWVALPGGRDVPQRGYMERPDDVCRSRNRLSLLCCPAFTLGLANNQVDPECLTKPLKC